MRIVRDTWYNKNQNLLEIIKTTLPLVSVKSILILRLFLDVAEVSHLLQRQQQLGSSG